MRPQPHRIVHILTWLQVLQFVLVAIALAITALRCYIRMFMERRTLTVPDYLVWGAWLSTLGFCIGSIIALNIQLAHPLIEPDLLTDSVAYMKVSLLSKYCREYS